MYQLILLIHVFAAVLIVALVLVQQGKGATVGAAFGSGASQTVFGSRGSGSFLFRLTVGLVVLFFVTSIVLNYLVVRAYKSEQNITLPFVPQSPPASPSLPANTATPLPVPPPASSVPSTSDTSVETQKAPTPTRKTTEN